MQTRIRYTKQENGLLVSKPMVAVTDVIVVTLDLAKLELAVLDSSNLVVDTGTASSVPALKMLAKTKARELGVVFYGEVRNGVKLG